MTRTHVVDKWAQTQSSGLGGQLECGARSFDYRPYLDEDGVLYAHHGMQSYPAAPPLSVVIFLFFRRCCGAYANERCSWRGDFMV